MLAELLKINRIKIEAKYKQNIKANKSVKDYYIFMILVAGNITDQDNTDEELRLLSELPVSVVIVGIGQGPFN